MSLVADLGSCTPRVPPGVQTVQAGTVGGGAEVVEVEVRRRDRRVPIQACTVLGSTPRASHRQATVCRRSWIRLPRATTDQFRVRLTADAELTVPKPEGTETLVARCASFLP